MSAREPTSLANVNRMKPKQVPGSSTPKSTPLTPMPPSIDKSLLNVAQAGDTTTQENDNIIQDRSLTDMLQSAFAGDNQSTDRRASQDKIITSGSQIAVAIELEQLKDENARL